jgi:hypothetical protein
MAHASTENCSTLADLRLESGESHYVLLSVQNNGEKADGDV